MEKENIIIQYISAWSWHIIGIIFLVGAFTVVFSGQEMGNNVIFAVFIFMWAFCELTALRRKSKLSIVKSSDIVAEEK